MTAAPNHDPTWITDPRFPSDPEFYRRVLHYMPTPIVVVDGEGQISYVNHATLQLGGWSLEEGADLNLLNYVHPDDRVALTTAFLEIAASPGARILGTGRPWAEIYFRILTNDGSALPIELVGTGGLLDPAVGGIIYEVRPAQRRDLLGRVLDGLSQGASMHQLLSLITEMISGAPLDLDAVVLQSAPDDSLVVAASTSPVLSAALRGDSAGLPWRVPTAVPEFVDIVDLPAPLRDPLRDAGYQDLWHVAVESPLTESTMRIVAASPTHHVPAKGPQNRLIRARELAAAVLLRTQADALLDYAAENDELTGLPNRAAFDQLAAAGDPLLARAAVKLDLDGLRVVIDALGVAAGDAILQMVADRVRASCSSDDVIGRVGDDEFAVLLSSENLDELQDRALDLAKRIHDDIGEGLVIAGRAIMVSTSIGVAAAEGGVSTDHVLTWADSAMRDAKRAGGDQIFHYGTPAEPT